MNAFLCMFIYALIYVTHSICYVYMHKYMHIMHIYTMTINVKCHKFERKQGGAYMGRFWGRKGKEETM